MEPVKQDIGVWVNLVDEKPDDGYYCICCKNKHSVFIEDAAEYHDGDFYLDEDKGYPSNSEKIISWLKRIKQVYILTEEQLNERDNKMYRKGQESVSVTDFNRDEYK